MAARFSRDSRTNTYIFPAIALAAAVIFFATTFRAGWNRAEFDQLGDLFRERAVSRR